MVGIFLFEEEEEVSRAVAPTTAADTLVVLDAAKSDFLRPNGAGSRDRVVGALAAGDLDLVFVTGFL